MKLEITSEELNLIKKIIIWDKFKRRTQALVNRIILILGIILIMLSLFYSIKNLNHYLIHYITVPGLFSGILLIWLYIVNRNIFKEKSKIASVFSRLLSEGDVE